MMKYETSLGVWQEDATFYNEPSNFSLNYDQQKANNETAQVTGFDDLLNNFDWSENYFDLEKSAEIEGSDFLPADIDLKDLKPSIDENTNFDDLFFELCSSNWNNSSLSSADITNESNILDFDFDDLPSQISSPGSSSDHPFSPEYEPISEPDSPLPLDCITIYDSPEVLPDPVLQNGVNSSPEEASVADVSYTQDTPVVFVSVCDNAIPEEFSQEVESVTIEEVSKSVRKRKFVATGDEIPKVRVTLKNNFHPYSKSTSKRSGNKLERKKVQNKEAAARYRVKKRVEEQELSDEVSGLEAEQKKLKTKHDDLENEIKYLKKLMCEMLQKKGII